MRSLLVLVAIIGLWKYEAHACSCAESSISESFAQTNAVFVGKVILKKPVAPKDELGWKHYDYVFEVSKSYKGLSASYAVLRVVEGDGGNCGLIFDMNKEYLLWAWSQGVGTLTTNMCSRTNAIEHSSEDLRWLERQLEQ